MRSSVLPKNVQWFSTLSRMLQRLCEVRNADAHQESSDTVIHFFQWLFDLAVTLQVTVTMNRRAAWNHRGTVKSSDDIKCADHVRGTASA